MLAGELLGGSDSTQAGEPRRLLTRAVSYLPEGHGEISARFDTGFYRVDPAARVPRARGALSISVPRSQAMWRALENIAEEQWQDAQELPDAQVAESTYAPQGWEHESLRLIVRRVAHAADALSDDPRARRRATIPAEQLNLGLTGGADVV